MNILLVIFDCLGSTALPHLAELQNWSNLQAEGVLYTNVIACMAVTTPNVASLLTGVTPQEHGVIGNAGFRLGEEWQTYPQILRQRKYFTIAQVTGPLVEDWGLSRGFLVWQGHNPWNDLRGYPPKLPLTQTTDLPGPWFGMLGIAEYPQPWFVMLHVWHLHEPRIAWRTAHRWSKENYAVRLKEVDSFIGKLHASLPENALLAITGDHGDRFARNLPEWLVRRTLTRLWRLFGRWLPFGLERFCLGHGFTLDDAELAVPLLVVGSGYQPQVVSAQIPQIDVVPTLMHMAFGYEPVQNGLIRGHPAIPGVVEDRPVYRIQHARDCPVDAGLRDRLKSLGYL